MVWTSGELGWIMAYTKREVTVDIERRIITGLIINDLFCRECLPMIKTKYFQTDYIRRIVGWVQAYHKKYKVAPKQNIESIFQAESQQLKEAESDIIEIFLADLSDQYEDEEKQQVFNVQYHIDQTVKFCKEQALHQLADQIEGNLLQGKIEKAEEIVRGFNKVSLVTSEWFNPFDEDEIDKLLEEDNSDRLFKLPGALGDLMGYFKREWLFSVMGPMKRGKSTYAWEIVYHALTAGLKVAWYSLEMNKPTVKKKIYQRLTAMAEQGGEYAYPVFDCKYNQDGSCNRIERKNKIKLLTSDGFKPKYKKDMQYRACVYCRTNNQEAYFPATWWATQYQEKGFDGDSIKKKVRAFKKMYGNNLRCRAYPAFSATVRDLIADYDVLEYTEGFCADVVLTDYLDITAEEVSGNELEDENVKWKLGKNFAGVKRCLLVNCNQSGRDSIEAKNIKEKHTGGNIKKGQHVDGEIVLNQTEKEKKEGIMRIQLLLHRHDQSKEKGQVVVLQALKLGQPFLDSEWVKKEREDEE